MKLPASVSVEDQITLISFVKTIEAKYTPIVPVNCHPCVYQSSSRRLEYFSDLQHSGELARQAQALLMGEPISPTATVLNKEHIERQELIFRKYLTLNCHNLRR